MTPRNDSIQWQVATCLNDRIILFDRNNIMLIFFFLLTFIFVNSRHFPAKQKYKVVRVDESKVEITNCGMSRQTRNFTKTRVQPRALLTLRFLHFSHLFFLFLFYLIFLFASPSVFSFPSLARFFSVVHWLTKPSACFAILLDPVVVITNLVGLRFSFIFIIFVVLPLARSSVLSFCRMCTHGREKE